MCFPDLFMSHCPRVPPSWKPFSFPKAMKTETTLDRASVLSFRFSGKYWSHTLARGGKKRRNSQETASSTDRKRPSVFYTATPKNAQYLPENNLNYRRPREQGSVLKLSYGQAACSMQMQHPKTICSGESVCRLFQLCQTDTESPQQRFHQSVRERSRWKNRSPQAKQNL